MHLTATSLQTSLSGFAGIVRQFRDFHAHHNHNLHQVTSHSNPSRISSAICTNHNVNSYASTESSFPPFPPSRMNLFPFAPRYDSTSAGRLSKESKEKHVKCNEEKCKLRYIVCFPIKKIERVMYLRVFFFRSSCFCLCTFQFPGCIIGRA